MKPNDHNEYELDPPVVLVAAEKVIVRRINADRSLEVDVLQPDGTYRRGISRALVADARIDGVVVSRNRIEYP